MLLATGRPVNPARDSGDRKKPLAYPAMASAQRWQTPDMRWLIRCLLLAPLALLLLAAAALWLAWEGAPRVPEPAPVEVADLARAHALLQRHHPGTVQRGVMRAAVVSQRDVELLLNQAGRRLGQARVAVSLQAGTAQLQLSAPLLGNAWGLSGWLNVRVWLSSTAQLLQVQALRVGRLPLPAWLAQQALPYIVQAMGLQSPGELAQRIVSRIDFLPQRLVLAYAWPEQIGQTLSTSMLPPREQARLRVYVEALALHLNQWPMVPRMSMAPLLPTVFRLARSRSTDEAQAQQENRSAMLALALVANRGSLGALVPSSKQWLQPRPVQFTLRGRPDFPLHFLISAVVAAEGGGPLADAVGVYKELLDVQGSSGFSFNDLAADRAGTRLGLQLVRSPIAMQQRLADVVAEAEVLPDVSDLPESLTRAEFSRRFGAVGAPAYLALMADIEARLDRLPLLVATPLH